MKITICGSMSFAREMIESKKKLESAGHICFLPEGAQHYADGIKINGLEDAKRKLEEDLIRKHNNLIKNSDAILVLNYDKNGIKNYIGGNSFLEIGFAYILDKQIYLLNKIPEVSYYDEIVAMQPIILNGDLAKIGTNNA